MKTIAIALFLGLSLIAGAIYFKSPCSAPSPSKLTSFISEAEIKDAVDKALKKTFPDGIITFGTKDNYTLKVTEIRPNDEGTNFKIYYEFADTKSNETIQNGTILERDSYGVWTTDLSGAKIIIKEKR